MPISFRKGVISEYNYSVLVSTMGLIITSIQRSLTPGER